MQKIIATFYGILLVANYTEAYNFITFLSKDLFDTIFAQAGMYGVIIAVALTSFYEQKIGLIFIAPEIHSDTAENITNIKIKKDSAFALYIKIPEPKIKLYSKIVSIANYLFLILHIYPYIEINVNIHAKIQLDPIVPSDEYKWDEEKKCFKLYLHHKTFVLPPYETIHRLSLLTPQRQNRDGHIDMRLRIDSKGNKIQKAIGICFIYPLFYLAFRLCYNPIKLKIENQTSGE